jgi:hypothetical protein
VAIRNVETIGTPALEYTNSHTALHDLQTGGRWVKEIARNKDGRYKPGTSLLPGDTSIWRSQLQPIAVLDLEPV